MRFCFKHTKFTLVPLHICTEWVMLAAGGHRHEQRGPVRLRLRQRRHEPRPHRRGQYINGFDIGVYVCEDEDGLVLPVDLDGGNDLSDNSPLALFSCIANDTDAENNFFGPTTESEVAALIENQGTGEVDFKPFVGIIVDLEAMATSSLTVASGGSVDFQYTVENFRTDPVRGDLYFVAERNGNQVARGIVRSGRVNPMTTVMGTFTQNVPSNAPAGEYTYRLRVGTFPDFFVDEEVFTVTVTGGARVADAPVASGEWSVIAEPWVVVTAEEAQAALAAAEAAEPKAAAPETDELPAAASAALPTELSVTSAPNPATHRAALTLAVPEAGPVTVTLYDVRGRELAVALNRELEAGTHTVGLDVSGLASGVYIVQAQSASQVAVRRITVVR